jgi:hypothetical protein
MKIELSKKLEEAGFKQRGDSQEYNGSYCPTLLELINACGDEFRWLKHRGNNWLAQQRQHPVGLGDISASGSTPDEAVANLWLKLKK